MARVLWIAAGLAASAWGQEFMAPKGPAAQYVKPHKPLTKLADLKAKRAGHAAWSEVIVDDDYLHSEYIQSAPGEKTPRALHPDTRTWWVIMEGQIRFDIEGQTPFVASKGSMVQVPMQTLFSMETIGDKPALRFETNIAHAKTLYPKGVETPRIPGFDWVPVRFPHKPGPYLHNNKPHVTFAEVAKMVESGQAKGTQKIVEDDRGAANFIYGYDKNLPPLNEKDRGHFHPECAEYWLIMAGQIRYPIEKVGVVIANEGDVVYVPKFTYHAPRWWGPGPSCRLAMNGYPSIAHLFSATPPE
jgi:mannose-6-phosphate isomerase-like protein (cupin superfamily)